MISAAQRYRNAVTKAAIRGGRNRRLMLECKADHAPCSDPRPDIIAEIERAYEAGRRDAMRENKA